LLLLPSPLFRLFHLVLYIPPLRSFHHPYSRSSP
jgi:hypothetical protein